MEVLDNPLVEFLQLKIVSRLGWEHIAPALASGSTPGRTLGRLLKNHLYGIVSLDKEVKANPYDLSTISTVF